MKTILVDCINALVIKGEGVYKPMYELLETYPNPKIVLTGANEEERKKFQLENVPYVMFTLEHNPDKVDPEYYKTMLKHFGLAETEVVYFEHDEGAVKSAESVGIVTHHYDQDAKDLDAVKKFLDENL